MEVKAKSTYDLKAIKALIRLSMFRKFDPGKTMMVCSIISLLFIVFTVAVAILLNIWEELWMCLVLFLIADLLFYYMYFLLPKIQYKSMRQLADLENTFVFTDNQLLGSTNGTNYSGSSTMEYAMIYRVKETKEYLFIYQNMSQAYIIDKSTIEGGTINDLRGVLSKILEKKYRIYNY